MASRKAVHGKHLAKLADKNVPCAFCKRSINDETIFGKLYNIGDIYCHYFCVLLSCCLIQKGKDEEGLFGFMYPDILAEIERSKKHRCSYCNVDGATLGCSITQCKKQFHLPCGREKNAVSLFYGNYKSYCEKHAPKQKIADVIMNKANSRLAAIRKIKRERSLQNLKKIKNEINEDAVSTLDEAETVCVICYEPVEGYPTTQTFWPPCCARDAWFHRSCLQRMALSAGMHYLKCPLCNDKDNFSRAVLSQGYYIPDRDAAWELEQNAFSEIYERPVVCRAEECKCPRGRDYDADAGMWDVKLCVLCGGPGSHSACCPAEYYVCIVCRPAAPDQTHLAAIDAVSLPSQNQSSQRTISGPIMPSRMSLRRTKRNLCRATQSSQNVSNKLEINVSTAKSNTVSSREELNLKPPKRPITQPTEFQIVNNELLSPLKLLKQGLNEKIPTLEVENVLRDSKLVEQMREKFRRPQPLCVKRRIVQKILDEIVDYLTDGLIKESNAIHHWNKYTKQMVPDEDISLIKNGTSDVEKHITDCDMSLNRDHTQDILMKNLTEGNDKNAVELEKSEISVNSPSSMKLRYEDDSSDINPIIDATKKLTKINIENDSMEISEDNQTVNIDLVKVQNETTNDYQTGEKKCALKIYPINKDSLDTNMDIDLESFKNQYLNEVDRKFHCKFANTIEVVSPKEELALDLSTDRMKTPTKQLVQPNHSVASKKRKTTKMVRKIIKRNETENISRNRKRKHRKQNTELSIRNRNINLKIRFKVDDIKVKFKKLKKKIKRTKKDNPKVLKQYVLQYPLNEVSSKELITRPDIDVTPPKRRYLKMDKSCDNLKQTSIESFFKRSPNTSTSI